MNVIGLLDVAISALRLAQVVQEILATLTAGGATQDQIEPVLTAAQERAIIKARARLRADMLTAGLPDKE